jgi:hypothetical protein
MSSREFLKEVGFAKESAQESRKAGRNHEGHEDHEEIEV